MKTASVKFAPLPTTIATIAAIGLVITSGLWAGKLTDRWGPAREFEVAKEIFLSFPRQIGAWEMDGDPIPMGDKALGILQCEDAYLSANFVHTVNQDRVSVILMAGPYGPLSVHKPTVCYPNAGLSAEGSPERRVFHEGEPEEGAFWLAKFRSGSASARPVLVGYGWSRGEEWQASDKPRFEFGGAPVLFKLQVDTRFDPNDDPLDGNDGNPCTRFLEDFLEVWQRDMAPRLLDGASA